MPENRFLFRGSPPKKADDSGLVEWSHVCSTQLSVHAKCIKIESCHLKENGVVSHTMEADVGFESFRFQSYNTLISCLCAVEKM